MIGRQDRWSQLFPLASAMMTLLSFLVLVILDSFGLLVNPLAKEAWTLLQIGLGGYVVGRSAEKIATQVIHRGDEK